jgi:predicted nucleic acid-binding protein
LTGSSRHFDPIALDTSFVVEALIATQPLHAVCRALLHRIDESGVSITTSDLLPVELAEAVFAIALKERWGSRWRQHRTDGRARRRAARLLNDTIAR